MMRSFYTPLALLLLAGCSSGSNANPVMEAPDASTSGGHVISGDDASASSSSGDDSGSSLLGGDASTYPDWQTLYTQYFAEGTIGHCSSCHAGGRGGFTTGSAADTMYQGMIAYGLVDTTHPTSSPIGVPSMSVLSWYNVPEQGNTTLDGRMPDDNAVANADAAAAVTAWVQAGARNHGLLPSGSGSGDDDDDDSGVTTEDAGPAPDAGTTDAGTPDSGTVDAGAPTWTNLYTNWFGPNTPGHCGNSYCHRDSGSSGGKDLVCGTTKSACFSGMVSSGLVSTSSPSTSKLGNPTTTPLSWFGHGGKMPDDMRMTDAAGAAAVTAWLNEGAKND